MLAKDFDRILDECIERVNRGDTTADCLSDYPAYSEKLRPVLETVHDIREACNFEPSADAKRTARQKFHAALGKGQEVTPTLSFIRLISRPSVRAALAVLVLAIVVTMVIPYIVNPSALVPRPDGNFAFLISDKPGDISDFGNLDVTVTEVQLQPAGSKQWLRLTPEIDTVDLTQVQGEQFQEIWRGHVPPGEYARLRIYVSEVKGQLESTRQTIDVEVPGGIVHMLIPFEITADMLTVYTFDITVVGTADDATYMLKLQINESGARQQPKLVD
jgi:hypothetical protein